jgi:hypothetical protein
MRNIVCTLLTHNVAPVFYCIVAAAWAYNFDGHYMKTRILFNTEK